MSLINSLLGIGKKAINTATGDVHGVLQGIYNDFHTKHVSTGIAPFQTPNLFDPAQNPTSVGRVWGTLAAQNAADQQNYTPQFRSTVMNAKPVVGSVSVAGAGGDYRPDINQIELKPDQLDPVTITHEGLHADYQKLSPQEKMKFLQVLQSTTPGQQIALHSSYGIGNGLYTSAAEADKVNEEHSFLPFYNQYNQDPKATTYYKQYFKNPVFTSDELSKYIISNTVNPKRYTPKFSDYKDE